MFLAAKKRRVQHSSIRTVQRFNGSVKHGVLPSPLPQAAKDILLTLGAGGVAGNAAVAANVVKSAVSYWAKRFLCAGALIVDEAQSSKTLGKPKDKQHFGPGYPKYYKLTPYGSKLLVGSEASDRLPVVFEDHPVKFAVLRWEKAGSIDWAKLGAPRNWRQMGFRVSGVRVVKTSKSVIVHPGPLMGFDVDQLEVDSGRIVERVRYILEVQFGMQLSDEAEFCHGPMWQVFRPEARAWVKQGGTVKAPGYGCLDASPKPWMKKLSGVAHVEFENKRHAALASVWPPVASDPDKRNASAAPLYPMYLEEIHQIVNGIFGQVESLVFGMAELRAEVGKVKTDQLQVGSVVGELKRLADALSKLENLERLPGITEHLERIVGVLSKLSDLEGGQASGSASSAAGGKDYVS
jgi:hypothetical protein